MKKEKTMKLLIALLAFALALPAFAGFRVINSSGTNVGNFSGIKCGDGFTCSKSGANAALSWDQSQVPTVVSGTSTVRVTLGSSDCGKVYRATGVYYLQLPIADSNIGCKFTFINGGASGPTFGIDPVSYDIISPGTDTAGDSIYSVIGGSTLVLMSTGGSTWSPISAETGMWADGD